jgi:hypothetical protein
MRTATPRIKSIHIQARCPHPHQLKLMLPGRKRKRDVYGSRPPPRARMRASVERARRDRE